MVLGTRREHLLGEVPEPRVALGSEAVALGDGAVAPHDCDGDDDEHHEVHAPHAICDEEALPEVVGEGVAQLSRVEEGVGVCEIDVVPLVGHRHAHGAHERGPPVLAFELTCSTFQSSQSLDNSDFLSRIALSNTSFKE